MSIHKSVHDDLKAFFLILNRTPFKILFLQFLKDRLQGCEDYV